MFKGITQPSEVVFLQTKNIKNKIKNDIKIPTYHFVDDDMIYHLKMIWSKKIQFYETWSSAKKLH